MSVTLSIFIKTPMTGIGAIDKKVNDIATNYGGKCVGSGYAFAEHERDYAYHFADRDIMPEPMLTELEREFPGVNVSIEDDDDDDTGHER